ncbi:DUF192 domain-containing protein [Rhizobium sp. WYJ-E13]|uniref:DUF192 domain-containing protein n=1 Tax=Rhizobium sp. WYJ-E13 TaxID=2849093 RepID=UPI001C1EEBC4|nr:DUF192 domain-containing protein [Rhizobium sp. WYJ-E13]QWW72466.1 DUF192 domain-containing protein [Rhizobium sp. WYJ-E13]
MRPYQAPLKRCLLACAFAVAGVLFIVIIGRAGSKPVRVEFQTAPLTIETAGGERFSFTVEIALSPAQLQRGLMYRTGLAPDRGMLFAFDHLQTVRMWMKNTFIPLDMLFLDASGVIISIKTNAVPFSHHIIASRAPARYAVELAGGTVSRLGITDGDRVDSPAMQTRVAGSN